MHCPSGKDAISYPKALQNLIALESTHVAGFQLHPVTALHGASLAKLNHHSVYQTVATPLIPVYCSIGSRS